MCECCLNAKAHFSHPYFDPACLFCGARIIQMIGTHPIAASVCATRRRAQLAVWVSYGHSETEIRRLAKGPICIGPGKVQESVARSVMKRR